MVLLAMIGASIASVSTFVVGVEERTEKVLGAHEIANRLILQYLDDRTQMPSSSLPLDYGRFRYRWDIEETSVEVATPGERAGDARRRAAPVRDRVRHLRVRVYESHGPMAQRGEQLVELTRLYDTLALARNPDALDRLTTDPARLRDLINELLGGGGGAR